MLASLSVLQQPAGATLQLLKPSPADASTFVGHGGYSADGLGQAGVGGTVQAEVPSGSTVVQAYLYGTYFFGSPAEPARTIDFDGTTVVLTTLPNSEPGNCCELYTARADITTQVATKVGSGGGITDFAVNSDPSGLDGVALVVLYSNPSSPDVTIAVLDGGSKQTGDTVTFNFSEAIDPTAADFSAIMSVGSGFSSQGVDGHVCGGGQFSTVAINGSPLTACAGNYDDGLGQNGALITVGGVGDSTNNPTDPTTQSGEDDELYDLVPLMDVGDTSLVIETTNPSGDDNLFLAVIAVTADAAVTTEICDNQVDDDGDGLVDGDDPDCQTAPGDEICDNQVDDDGDGLVDGDDPDCQTTPEDESLSGTKYYDSNTNGQRDDGEPGIEDWLIDISDGGLTTVATESDGTFSVDVEAGQYTVAEQQGGGDWMQTGNSVDASTGSADVTLNPDGTYTVEIEEGESAAGLDFGNVCLGEGGAHTRGFWQNKNGKALFQTDTAGAVGVLTGLNLVKENGDAFDPANYDQFRDWIRKARAGKNSAYMLSAQLATMALNVHFELVDGDAWILAEGTDAANDAGFATVQDVIDEADAALAADPDGDDTRSYQLLLSDVLDAANNNHTFVQAPDACDAPVFPDTSADLFADGSVSCAGADDTTKPAGTVTFTPTQDKVVFAIDLSGVEPNQDYNVVISEDGDCDPVYFNPDGVELTTDAAGDGTFSGEFVAPDGTHNLLVNIVATDGVTDPKDREIATVDTNVVVL